MRKICTMLAALALVFLIGFVFLPTEAQAAEITASGTCGDNLTWTLDDAGTLTISGTGAMKKDYSATGAPWYSRRSSIKNVVIASGVTSIGKDAFYNCRSLASVTIPDSVTNIAYNAFSGCIGLNAVYITDIAAWCGISYDYPSYSRYDHPPLGYSHNLYVNEELVTELVIPDSVESIKAYAFSGCSMTSITILDSVTSIGQCAFWGCSSLTGVTLPDSIATIGEYSFHDCPNLSYNLYGNGKYLGNAQNPYVCLIEIEDSCDLVIPSTIKAIYPNVCFVNSEYDGCFGSLTYHKPSNVYISDLAAWCNISFREWSEWIIIDIGQSDVFGSSDVVYYNNPLFYAQNLYVNGKLATDLVIPKGVTEVGNYAFVGCNNISSVVIPTSVTSIGTGAFQSCNLENVTYCGTSTQWNNIKISGSNSSLTNATRTYHKWSNNIITQIEPTYTTTGMGINTCLYCSEQKTETIPAKFYGTSVNLGNTLDMYFGFYTGLVDENGTVKFVREFADGTTETTTAPITSFKKNNSVYDITYTGLAAKEMCDTIHIYVYNGEGTLVGEHSDSIRSYILRQLREKDYGQEFRTLCVDLLNYGAAAQNAFTYNTDDLANKDLTAEELAEGTQKIANYTDKQTISGMTGVYYGTAYILETRISMAMAVRADALNKGCYALVSYTDHTGKEKSDIRIEGILNYSVYEFFLDEIVVADGRCLLTVEFYKADGTKVVTVQDSMESYTARNAEYYPLAEKMLAFSDSAYSYLH